MKDLITVFTYCPDNERKKILQDLLSQLNVLRDKFDIDQLEDKDKEKVKVTKPEEVEEQDSLMNESIKIFNQIGLDIANSALPAVGDFIVAFAKLTKLFFDAESIAIFFKTLAVILEGIVALLDNDVAKAIISGIGALVAFGLAIGLLQNIFGFFGKVLLGAMANMVRLFSVIMPSGSAEAATLRGAMTALATGNIAAAAPLLLVVAAIVALVAIFKLAWDNNS